MIKVWKIAIIFMLILPIISHASAEENSYSELDDASDPSFKKVDFKIKDVTIYPGGIVLITKEATISSGNKFYSDVEGSIYPGAIRIVEDGGFVSEISVKNKFKMFSTISSTIWNIETLLKGSLGNKVELITNDAIYHGSVLWVAHGYIFLSDAQILKILGDSIEHRNASFVCLKVSDVENIIFMEKPDLPDLPDPSEVKPVGNKPSKTRIMWTDTGTGSRKVTLIYLTNGISWESRYNLDTFTGETEKSSRLEHWAIITNNLDYDFTDITVKLVAGNIKLDGSNGDYGVWTNSIQERLTGFYFDDENSYPSSSTPSSFTMEEFEVYEIPSKVTLKKGETNLFPLKTGDVEIEIDYVYDATHLKPNRNRYRTWEDESYGKVKKIFKVKNNGKTWPNGMVSVYQDYMLIGQDTIAWTPKGREAKITIGSALDIEVKKKVTVKRIDPENRYDDDFNYTITITLHNYKDEKVTVKVFDEFDSKALDLESNTDFSEKPGNLMEWTVSLKSGEEKDIVYTYKTID